MKGVLQLTGPQESQTLGMPSCPAIPLGPPLGPRRLVDPDLLDASEHRSIAPTAAKGHARHAADEQMLESGPREPSPRCAADLRCPLQLRLSAPCAKPRRWPPWCSRQTVRDEGSSRSLMIPSVSTMVLALRVAVVVHRNLAHRTAPTAVAAHRTPSPFQLYSLLTICHISISTHSYPPSTISSPRTTLLKFDEIYWAGLEAAPGRDDWLGRRTRQSSTGWVALSEERGDGVNRRRNYRKGALVIWARVGRRVSKKRIWFACSSYRRYSDDTD